MVFSLLKAQREQAEAYQQQQLAYQQHQQQLAYQQHQQQLAEAHMRQQQQSQDYTTKQGGLKPFSLPVEQPLTREQQFAQDLAKDQAKWNALAEAKAIEERNAKARQQEERDLGVTIDFNDSTEQQKARVANYVSALRRQQQNATTQNEALRKANEGKNKIQAQVNAASAQQHAKNSLVAGVGRYLIGTSRLPITEPKPLFQHPVPTPGQPSRVITPDQSRSSGYQKVSTAANAATLAGAAGTGWLFGGSRSRRRSKARTQSRSRRRSRKRKY